MTKRIVLAGLILIAIIMSVGIHFYSQEVTLDTYQHKPAMIPFTNSEGLTFLLSTTSTGVQFSGLGYIDLPLTAVESASGAKYENKALKLTIWNKGEELSVYQNDELIFTGSKGNAVPSVAEVDPVLANELSSEYKSLLTTYTWQWMKDGQQVGPSEDSPFTLHYQTDGNLVGTTDCNNFSAHYELTATTTIAHFDFMSTKMSCLGSIEAEYIEKLSQVTNYYVNEGLDLVLETKGGQKMYYSIQLIPML